MPCGKRRHQDFRTVRPRAAADRRRAPTPHARWWYDRRVLPALAHSPPAVTAALGRFRTALSRRFAQRLRELVLFGSWARGEAHEDSDVDVLVVVDELTESERGEVMDLAYDADAADRDAWVGISPLPYSTVQAADLRSRERLLFREIARDGVAV